MNLFGFGKDNYDQVMSNQQPRNFRSENPLCEAIRGYQEQRNILVIQLTKAIDASKQDKIDNLNLAIAKIDDQITQLSNHSSVIPNRRKDDTEEIHGRR